MSNIYTGDTTSGSSRNRSGAADDFERLKDQAATAAEGLAEQGREMGAQVSAMAGNVRTAVERSVREQPMTTLVITAALGFVIGALWKS